MPTFIQRLLPIEELLQTVKRFPASVVCALLLFCIVLNEIHDLFDFDEEYTARVFFILSCSYLWFGGVRLMRESVDGSLVKHIIIAAVGFAWITYSAFSGGVWAMNFMFVIPALLLFLMFAPYLKSGDDTSVWLFNRTMWLGILISYIALLMFAGGITTALLAIHVLFDTDQNDEIIGDVWAFAGFFLGPVYALSWVPKRFDFTAEDCNDPPGLKFIVNWISAPMIFIYLAILYAYFGKIIITQDIPNGYLAYLITGFVGAGIVTYLVSWPLRESSSFQLRLFHKIFFPAMLIPVGFHFFAIAERVSAYGITEQRYMLGLSAFWFLLVAVSNLRTRMPIKAMPATLCFLFVIGSIGPWGGIHLSAVSQEARLEALLVKNELLKDGKAVKKTKDISFEDRRSISSILEYLCYTDREYILEQWFDLKRTSGNGEEYTSCSVYDITKDQLGFDYVSSYQSERQNKGYYSLYGSPPPVMRVTGYDYYIENLYSYSHELKKPYFRADAKPYEVAAHLDKDGGVSLYLAKDIVYEKNIVSLISDNRDTDKIDGPISFDFENENIKGKIMIYSFNAQDKDGIFSVSNIGFSLLYSLKGVYEHAIDQ